MCSFEHSSKAFGSKGQLSASCEHTVMKHCGLQKASNWCLRSSKMLCCVGYYFITDVTEASYITWNVIFWASELLFAAQEELSCMELTNNKIILRYVYNNANFTWQVLIRDQVPNFSLRSRYFKVSKDSYWILQYPTGWGKNPCGPMQEECRSVWEAKSPIHETLQVA